LRELFGAYGEITGVKILTDKLTGMHKGCAFLTYRTKQMCDAAIQAIHNKKVFPPAKNPIQVKYADGQLERFENKLFVGQIPKDKTEQDIHDLFGQYGEIEKINLLKDANGTSKGCCFVKFRHRQDAEAAIKGLADHRFDNSVLATGLVVKFADNEQQRTQRKMAKAVSHFGMGGPLYGVPGVYTPYAYFPAYPSSYNSSYISTLQGFTMVPFQQHPHEGPTYPLPPLSPSYPEPDWQTFQPFGNGYENIAGQMSRMTFKEGAFENVPPSNDQ